MNLSDIYLYISTILHELSQALMIPVMVALGVLILFSLFIVGSVIAESLTERRHYSVNSAGIINSLHDADYSGVSAVINGGRLLKPQRRALTTVALNMGLSSDELFALARTEIEKVNDGYKRKLILSEQVTKIAPMLGLMCTLIPLGPGIVAMGQGNVAELSMSLLIAFDGTVAGLVAAIVAMVVTAVRRRWYGQYILVLESLMTAILDKANTARDDGANLPRGRVAEDIVEKSQLEKNHKKGE
ncbi:MAG: MotA/TolQ/ExbB proton channel family protein [Clostridiales Family XIII bacterium]|jgi:biopolymer transport protein ExbB/TolQ|nr:MotA/TolQ/ExbB proton channel family protein [Clostridiales Family XIII bacterium]